MVPAKDRNDKADVLVSRVYDAAVGLASWHDVLRSIARMFRGSAALLNIVGQHRSARITQVGVDPACEARYLERHAGRNELAIRWAAPPVGAIVTDGDLLPRAEFPRTSFYDDCFRPQGFTALMNLRAARGKDGTVSNLCVVRSARQDDFDRADVAAFARLAPHLLRAVAVHVRLAAAEGERRALAETFEHLPRAAFLVDAAGAVRLANSAGAALLAARDGLRADRGEGGSLRAARADETAALRRLVAAATVGGRGEGRTAAGGHVCVSRPPPKPPLVVTAVPVGADGSASAGLPSTAVALLIVADPDIQAPLPSADLLRDAFKLTRAEAEVAVRAARGNGVPTVAASLGISQGTTRLHLHRVFEKVGARRQAELTAVLARLGP